MADRFRAPGGWTVEVVCLTGTPDKHDGPWLRLRQFGYWVADIREVSEIEHWFPLADLEQEVLTPAA